MVWRGQIWGQRFYYILSPSLSLRLSPSLTLIVYSAPEIIEDAQAYPQSDMWSLGVLLYVMLSGQLPFKGESAEETRENIVNVRFKFEWLYKEVTMEATRLLMWIFKRTPW